MGKVYEWYSRLSPWYQAALLSLFFGIFMGGLGGLALGKLGAVQGGFLLGLIIGLAYYYRERRDPHSWIFPEIDEAVDDYPKELERVERRHAKQDLILFHAFMVTGIAGSWIIFGIGTYGLIGAVLAMVAASWALGRFGGPSDPKWKRVKDEWKRRHGEAGRAR